MRHRKRIACVWAAWGCVTLSAIGRLMLLINPAPIHLRDTSAPLQTPTVPIQVQTITPKAPRTSNHKPKPVLLFEDRLAANLLGGVTTVSADQVRAVEPSILNFVIPKPLVLEWPSDTVPLTFRVYGGTEALCPNCRIVPRGNTGGAKVDAKLQPLDRTVHSVPLVCGCGEAESGTGRSCFSTYKSCTFQNSFKRTDNLWQTYSRLQYSPPDRPTSSVASMVAQMLRPWQRRKHCPLSSATVPLVALHSNCRGARGQLLADLRDVLDSYGACWHNRNLAAFDPPRSRWHYGDSEANRDSVKTDVSSCYKVTAALENTLEDDYVTEKLYQALVSGSVPLVWGRKNLYYLPLPDAGILVSDFETTQELKAYLHALAVNTTLYYERHQAWKEQGRISSEFASLLFRGDNFLPCRVCEALSAAHNSKNAN